MRNILVEEIWRNEKSFKCVQIKRFSRRWYLKFGRLNRIRNSWTNDSRSRMKREKREKEEKKKGETQGKQLVWSHKGGHVYVSSRASSVSCGINELTSEYNGRQNAEYLLAYDANAASLLCMTITLPNSSPPWG